jgi:Flp pilus assembly CpaF family ATPase
LRRLETLVLMAGMDLPVRVVREQIQSAVHILIQQSRMRDGSRKIVSITEVTGMEGDTLTTQEIFRFHQTSHTADACLQGVFESTGIVSSFSQDMAPLALAV